MHELSIALSMIEMATEEVKRLGNVRVNALHLKVGALSGVATEALLFSYDVAAKDTPLEGSRLVIEMVPVVIYCSRCESEQMLNSLQHFACPVCGQLSADVRQGRELEVVALEIEETESAEALVS